MAAKKKRVRRGHVRRSPRTDDTSVRREFVEDVQQGNGAIEMFESRNQRGELQISFDVEEDDP
jgi:hypothetical protein